MVVGIFYLNSAEGSFPGAECAYCNLSEWEQGQTEVNLVAGLLD